MRCVRGLSEVVPELRRRGKQRHWRGNNARKWMVRTKGTCVGVGENRNWAAVYKGYIGLSQYPISVIRPSCTQQLPEAMITPQLCCLLLKRVVLCKEMKTNTMLNGAQWWWKGFSREVKLKGEAWHLVMLKRNVWWSPLTPNMVVRGAVFSQPEISCQLAPSLVSTGTAKWACATLIWV